MTRPDTTIEAILLDLDGTLIDTDDHTVELLTRRLTPLARLLSFDANGLARRHHDVGRNARKHVGYSS